MAYYKNILIYHKYIQSFDNQIKHKTFYTRIKNAAKTSEIYDKNDYAKKKIKIPATAIKAPMTSL